MNSFFDLSHLDQPTRGKLFEQFAQRIDTDPEILDCLVELGHHHIDYMLANNKATLPITLDKLAHRYSEEHYQDSLSRYLPKGFSGVGGILNCIVWHPQVSVETLGYLIVRFPDETAVGRNARIIYRERTGAYYGSGSG